ncbi:hypothetical protein A4A49_39937 [Nicotiana attenuata]|uniref:DNA replication factor Dna2 N-terminal domain-containing protein n=1 Tax=Nicotiana attenuata TaxID=49451 RepID=A0A1J6K9F0_NICAT|nr:hypothetical protein A4A49_39937 [Nicotiana attenuata]
MAAPVCDFVYKKSASTVNLRNIASLTMITDLAILCKYDQFYKSVLFFGEYGQNLKKCYSVVAPGDTIHVIGEFDSEGKCEINREKNFLIVHPDILVSGTRVASSFSCSRRAVLDERLKSGEYSAAALIGTLLHQMFQAGLIRESPTQEFLEDYARIVLQKSLESLYACGDEKLKFLPIATL